MNDESVRSRGQSGRALLLSLCIGLVSCQLSGPKTSAHATRHDLIGTWRLLSIRLVGPDGPTVDPFFGTDPSGILVYDPSGWMSVQIVAGQRPAMDAPASFVSRETAGETTQDVQLKASVLDTYYAYFGRWRYDEATSSVVHDIESSLIPGESGKSYSQTVSLVGGHLVFSRRAMNGAIVQEKVWERVTLPER